MTVQTGLFRTEAAWPSSHPTHRLFRRMQHYGWVVFRALLLIGICYTILFPVLVKLSASLMSRPDLWNPAVKWIPRQITFINYPIVWEAMRYPAAFLNSFSLALLLGLLQVASCTLVGYGLAMFRFRANAVLFGLAIFTLLVPPEVVLIPLYLNLRFFTVFGLLPSPGLNLLGSAWPFVLTSAGAVGIRNGLFIFIVRQYFKGMPRDLKEAAYVDGAGPFRTFFTVMLPGAVPALVIVFLFAFVWQWNDYYFTSIYMGNSVLLPITLENAHRVVLGEYIAESARQESSMLHNTGSMLLIAPLLLLYAVMQRYFVESIERTGMTGT